MADVNFDINKLRVGDIFNYIPLPLSTAKDPMDWLGKAFGIFIAKVTWSKYNHTSQVVAIFDVEPRINITEALPKLGVYTKPFNPKWFPNITIFRPGSCSAAKSKEAANWWRSKNGSKYDYVAAGLSGFRNFFNFFRREKLIFDNQQKYFCSNGVALGYAEQGVQISKSEPSQCTPGDIGRNKDYLVIVE